MWADKKIPTVRVEFQSAFQSCSSKEQLAYYSKATKFLTAPEKIEIRHEEIGCEI